LLHNWVLTGSFKCEYKNFLLKHETIVMLARLCTFAIMHKIKRRGKIMNIFKCHCWKKNSTRKSLRKEKIQTIVADFDWYPLCCFSPMEFFPRSSWKQFKECHLGISQWKFLHAYSASRLHLPRFLSSDLWLLLNIKNWKIYCEWMHLGKGKKLIKIIFTNILRKFLLSF
jgi:hypothetical protein